MNNNNNGILLIIILTTLFFFYKKYWNTNEKTTETITEKNIETFIGTKRIATDLDHKRAVKYAMQKMCEKGGYAWIQGADEFTYDCKHTQQTCMRESVYPTQKDAVPQYYEWRDRNSPEAKEAGLSGEEYGTGRTISGSFADQDIINSEQVGGVCIIGNEPFRDFCEGELLRYDTSDGKCYTTKEYCNPRLLAFCNGDCFETPTTKIVSSVFGTNIGRLLGSVTADALITKAVCGQEIGASDLGGLGVVTSYGEIDRQYKRSQEIKQQQKERKSQS